MNYLIDTHAHLDFPELFSRLNVIIKNAQTNNVLKIITISTNLDKIQKIINISNDNDNIYFTVGVHPNEVLKDKFEFNLDWQYRYNFEENIAEVLTRQHRYFVAGFSYAFFSLDGGAKSAKIGIDYTNGENPTKNFENQSFYAISLKVKI